MSIHCARMVGMPKTFLLRVCCVVFIFKLGVCSPSNADITPSLAVMSATDSLRGIRIFEEPLIPVKATTAAEDDQLLMAARAYQKQDKPDDFRLFTDFLAAHPQSGWRISLLTNLGLSYYHYGYFSKAIGAWSQAWQEGRDIEDPQGKVLVDRAAGELVRMHARLGHSDELEKLLIEIGDRPVSGSATEAVTGAQEGLWKMKHEPGVAYLCGPKALKNLMLSTNHSTQETQFLDGYRSGPHGVTLAQVADLAKQAKLSYKLAYRESRQDIPVPSLVHWKVNHFAAIVAKDGDRYHLKDPTFGTDLWVTADALDSESSGYFLFPQNQLGEGFREVSLAEANNIRGMGYTATSDPVATRPYDNKGHSSCGNQGMCGYNFHAMVVSLNLTDTPVGYKPPKGPSVFVTLTYNQREANQPSIFNFFNVSPKWTINWLSFIQDDPNAAGASVMRYVAGGGALNYTGYNSTTGTFTSESYDGTVMTRIGSGASVSYRRTLRDGSVEVYGQSDGATAYPRRLFLTRQVDPAGNAVTLAYDSQLRLTAITDANGKITTFSYAAANPLLITTITDPYGRSAQLSYDTSGRLQQITDTLGLTSQFSYDSSSLINSMTTPYGTTQFVYGSNGTQRWLEITDPLGQTERAEFRQQAPGIPYSESQVPAGITAFNQYIDARNTFFWDKSIYPTTHTDYTKAQIKHFLHITGGASGITSGVIESTKDPLENRVWRNYPGQSGSAAGAFIGTFDQPSLIGRVLPDGTTQLTQIAYNSQGNRTSVIDPMGRQTLFDYAANGIDVVAVRQKTGSNLYTTIAQYTYNSQHQPLTYTDWNGAITTYTYNAAGQKLTETDPLGHVTTYQYDILGNLTAIIDANSVAVASFTYDSVGRVATRSDAANNTLSYQYDNFDRLTKIVYPDGTYYQYQYDKLDLVSVRDRLGLITQYTYDANRQLTSVTDPAGHATQYAYYPNGTLKTTTDALNGVAQRAYDIQARLTSVTDPRGIQTTYTYDVSGNRVSENSSDSGLTQFTFDKANSIIKKIDARNVQSIYGYDPFFKRLISITYPASTSENVTFTYDDATAGAYRKGRLYSVATTSSTVAFSYDANGNPTGIVDFRPHMWGSSQYQYDNNNRLSQITYPSGEIVDYTRNALGQITQVQMRNNANSTPWTIVNNITYEPFGPLNGLAFGNGVATTIAHDADYRVSRMTTTSTPGWDYVYSYDAASNLIGMTDQIGSANKTYTYDALGRVLNDSASFLYQYDAGGNRTLFTIPGWFSSTQQYANSSNQLIAYGGTSVPSDAAGNMTARGNITAMSYNNANRLKQATFNSVTTNYQYTGLGQRDGKTGAQTINYDYLPDGKYLSQMQFNADNSFKQAMDYIWLDDTPIAQTKVTYAANNTPSDYRLTYIHADHLNAPRTMTNGVKAVVWSWGLDAYGVTAANDNPDGNSISDPLDLRFPGQVYDAETKLLYNMNRYYDPLIGRYTQSDPIGLAGGLNTYAYVDGNPISLTDPTGECPWCVAAVEGAAVDVAIQLMMNGGKPECIKWESVALTALVSAINPFSVTSSLAKAAKAQKQLQRARTLNPASRAAKRVEQRSDKTRAAAQGELIKLITVEGATEGASNLLPDKCGCN